MAFTDRFTAAARALLSPPAQGEVLVAQKVIDTPLERTRSPSLETKASEAQRATWLYRTGVEQFSPSDYRQLVKRYRTNAIVRQCVKLISEAVAQIDPVVKVGGRETTAVSEQLKRYLKKPNPVQDGRAFAEWIAAFFTLNGNAFVEFVPGMSKGYAEFYALRPELVTITPGADGWPQAYSYRPSSGAVKKWPVDIQRGKASILHIKAFSPDDDLWGRGALTTCERELNTYENAFDLAASLMKNGAMPSGAMRYAPKVGPGDPEPRMDEEQFQRLKKQINDQTDMAKKGRPLLLEGGLEWQSMSFTPVETGAEEIRNGAARGIAIAFGVPPMLLGIPGDNTYSNYSEANRAFYRQAVIPLAARIYGALGRWWAQLGDLPDLELEIDEDKIYALADELSARWTRLDNSKDLTIDERREGKGYEKLPNGMGNRVLITGFDVPLDTSLATAELGITQTELGIEGQQLSNDAMAAM
ncbi:MAG TPA: phage portal protein, partial [Polyangiaceae bacterium]|nr:phage portal protein [Polyangiaceae bacterium]